MFSLLIRRDGLIDPPQMDETDTHCHLLPGMDDGPVDDRGSLAIARLLMEIGVRKVVATPHVISDLYPNTTTKILNSVARMKQLLKDNKLNIEVVPGAEYYAEIELLRRIEKNDILCFGEKRYVLFESPVEHKPMILDEIIFGLKSNGYTPLLAHAERYRFLQADHGLALHLHRLGVCFQINHPSFMLPKTSRRGETARWFYVKGLVETLGTDMHRATSLQDHFAQPKLSKRRKRSENRR